MNDKSDRVTGGDNDGAGPLGHDPRLVLGIDRDVPAPSRHSGHVVVGLFALAFFLPGAWWGIPHATAPNRSHAWGVDDETPLGALSEIHNIVEPKGYQNLGYPLMYPFMTGAASLPYLGFLKVSGGFSTPRPDWPFGFANPVSAVANLGLIAHLVTVLLATGLVIAAYDAGRTMKSERRGFLVALLALLAYPMAYYGRTGNVDVPMLFFIAVAFAAYARCVMRGVNLRRAIALGAAAGFALGTKEAALGVFIGMPFVLLPLQSKAWHGGLRTWAAWKPLVAALAVALIALGAGSGLFVDPDRYIAHIRFLTERVGTLAVGDTPTHQTFPMTLTGNLAFAGTIIADLATIMSWPGLMVAAAGASLAVFRRSRIALLLVPAITYIVWMMATLRVAQLRYMLPGAFLLAPFAAALLHELWSATGRRRVLAVGIASIVFGILGLRSVDLTYQMIRDSRYAAAGWLASQTADGDLVEYFGPDQKLPPLPAGVTTQTAAPYRGMYVAGDWSDAAIASILEGWAQRAPKFIITMPDHTSPDDAPHSASLPPELFRRLMAGTESWELVATFETAPLFPWLGLPALDYPVVNPPISVFGRVVHR